jgi:hypothetical protein
MTVDVLASPPVAALPLHEIVERWKAGHRPVEAYGYVTLPCACGGSITAWNRADRIESAVTVHNRRRQHEAWAIESGWRHG